MTWRMRRAVTGRDKGGRPPDNDASPFTAFERDAGEVKREMPGASRAFAASI